MTNVTIISALATRNASAWMTSWTGEADVTLDTVFRFFNRVDEADCDRLEALGYNMPSLSVDDLVVLDGVTYQVAATGFTKLDPPAPCGWCRRCAIHDDPGGCLEVSAWERETMHATVAA